jgi:hypothetical protein
MSRFLCSAVVVVVMVVVAGIAVIAAPASAGPDEDFVIDAGEMVVGPLGLPPAVIGVAVDAHNDAAGANPSGTFSISMRPTEPPLFSGAVTCLVVTDKHRNHRVRGCEGRPPHIRGCG